MLFVWIVFFIELLIYFIFKAFVENHELLSVVLIIFNMPFVLLVIFRYKEKVSLILFLGYFIRLFFMFWDIYAKEIFQLPHSGDDSEGFFSSSLQVSNDMSLLSEQIYGGLYSKVLGIIYFLGPSDRILGQYINVLLGFTVIILVWKILTELRLDKKVKIISLIIMTLFPSGIIFSSIFLRESLISLFVTLSFYNFVKWYKTNKVKRIIFAIIIILIGASLHSGVIGILIGYIFMILFYNHSTERLVFTFKSNIIFIFFTMLIIVMNSYSLESIPFLNKFTTTIEKSDDFYNIVSGSGRGESSYLTSLSINNPIDLIIYSPIKMLYFLMSPFPWDWRGLFDIISFLLDGIIYFILFFYPIINYKKINKDNSFIIGLIIMLLATVFIFGIGVTNAGTAMRHRYKIFYLFIILFSITYHRKRRFLTRDE